MRVAWTASGACTSGSTAPPRGATRRVSGGAATTSTTTVPAMAQGGQDEKDSDNHSHCRSLVLADSKREQETCNDCDCPNPSHLGLLVPLLELLSYSSWRRHQTPVSLRPLGARSSHWYMPQRPSRPRA